MLTFWLAWNENFVHIEAVRENFRKLAGAKDVGTQLGALKNRFILRC